MISHSSRSADSSFDHVAIRNVRVTVQDDDKPGLTITQTGNGTLGLEGSLTTTPRQGIEDSYDVSLTRAPSTTLTVRLIHDGQVGLVDSAGNPLSALAFTPPNRYAAPLLRARATHD